MKTTGGGHVPPFYIYFTMHASSKESEIMKNETQRIFPQEFFDDLFLEAVGDLRKSGFKEEEVFSIINNQFGINYARRFCGKKIVEKDANK